MVQMTVRLTSTSTTAHQLVEALHSLMRRARSHNGFSDAHITVDVDDENIFWYWEDWDSVRALECEIRGDRFFQLLALMETSACPPLLQFRVVSETRGLEYVATVREAARS
jgi:quinol monooxygenase YgiN